MKYHHVKDPIRIYNELLGGKWRLLILYQLFQKTQRFKDLTCNIEGITPRMLTKELRTLEKYNLVEKEVYREVPPRVEYSLSDEGVRLYPLIESIIRFGEEFAHLLSGNDSLTDLSKKKNQELAEQEILLTKDENNDIESNDHLHSMSKYLEALSNLPTSLEDRALEVIEESDSSSQLQKIESDDLHDIKVSEIVDQYSPPDHTLEEVSNEQSFHNNSTSNELKNNSIEIDSNISIPEIQPKKNTRAKPVSAKKLKISQGTNAVQLELF